MPAQDVIAVAGLRRTFGAVTAVDNLSVAVHAGEMFGLVGPDGAGKTTAIRMLCGLLAPENGTAVILGHDLIRHPDRVKREIGYLSQRFSLYGDLTIDENIEFFAGINGVRDYRSRRDELLAFTRLTPFRDRLAEALSGGMKQKLALACTLIHTPRVLLLDEPTTGVDPVSRRDLWRILHGLLADGMTIVMSTPYLDEAERCTRVALMSRGRLLVVDTPRAIRGRMQGVVVELVCDRIREAAGVLRRLPAVKEVQAFGDRLNVVVGRQEDLHLLQAALAQSGIPVAGTRAVGASLENVFISLLAGNESAEVAA